MIGQIRWTISILVLTVQPNSNHGSSGTPSCINNVSRITLINNSNRNRPNNTISCVGNEWFRLIAMEKSSIYSIHLVGLTLNYQCPLTWKGWCKTYNQGWKNGCFELIKMKKYQSTTNDVNHVDLTLDKPHDVPVPDPYKEG